MIQYPLRTDYEKQSAWKAQRRHDRLIKGLVWLAAAGIAAVIGIGMAGAF